ncbi:uncharacterized protein KQ657_003906 [Scheffersomyces spartinae]|uniref:Rhodanese domain-containing protein n=1 Tax=Scheffersomyces spartinae TaxID=45513 RepID=A0A9P8AKR7_9ASCO|nr:uncharacterized protein KQ657_003906 [Scheffersomyces spartinae]KAG7195377.1 hypothetical protein KQ657_003906 [Scheffersomyces spartinae]
MADPRVVEWLKVYPEPKTTASYTEADEVLTLLKTTPETIAIIDLRNDRDPGYLKESVHIPAITLTDPKKIREEAIDLVKEAKPTAETIIVHCNSSKQRAVKVAGTIQDYLDQNNVPDLKVTVLKGGIAGWLPLDEPYKSFVIPTLEA